MQILKKVREHRRLTCVVLILVLLVVILVCCSAGSDKDASDEDAAVAQGISYLESLEAIGPQAVDTLLKEQRAAEIQAMRDERLRQLESGEISVWSLFEDYVILGDSRTCGFMFGNYLDNDRILAAYGDYITAVERHIPSIEKYDPSYIFLCYGLNDIVQIGWETPEAYIADCRDILADLQARFPDAKIYVNSIFRCYEPAISERWEKWSETQEYSDAVQQMCEEEGYYFIENENIDESMAYLWQEDGIHFISEFYPIWATNMIMEVYDSEIQQEDSAA